MDYLARYRAGECEAVWDELRQMDVSAQHELAEEAEAITRLSIGRARSNLQRIADGLTRIGYVFDGGTSGAGASDLSRAAASAEFVASNVLDQLDSMGLSPAQSEEIRVMAENLQRLAGRSDPPSEGLFPNAPKGITRPLGDNGLSIEHVETFERDIHPLPLALAEFWRSIGHVDFAGTYKAENTSDWVPLLVLPCLGLTDDYREYIYDNGSSEGFSVELAANPGDPDYPLEVKLAFGVDTKLTSGEWFMDYLRRATKSAGFLSLNRAEMPSEFASIADGWEPF